MQEAKLKNQEKNEECLFMATNTTDMSPNEKAYFVSERRRILAEKADAEVAEDDEEEVEEEAAA